MPLEPDVEHQGKRRRNQPAPTRWQADASSPPGPRSVEDTFGWAGQYLEALRSRGAAVLGVNLSLALKATILAGLLLHADYSGIGCPEHAMSSILQAAREEYPEDADAFMAAVRCPQAGDIKPWCRSVLLARDLDSEPLRPGCVFGDITERCSPKVYKRGKALILK